MQRALPPQTCARSPVSAGGAMREGRACSAACSVGRKVGHLSGTWSSISLLSSCPFPFCVFVLGIVVGARACPRGAKAAKRAKRGRHVSATPNRPRPGNLAHFWPRPGNLVLQVIWSTFCQNVAEVICPSLLIYQVFWPSNSGPPGILALHFEKPGILAGCKTRAQVICPAVFGKPGNLPRIFGKTR